MDNSKTIKELFALRSIACLSVVFLHCIATGLQSTTNPFSILFFDSLHILLYFSTPVFIFISEFLLSYAYRNKAIPTGFLKKRAKYLLLPFLFMAAFYSIPHGTSFSEWTKKLFMNAVIGVYHGYFILIILQFYVFHILFHRLLKKFNPTFVLPFAFLINVGYLSFFHFVDPLPIAYSEYIWERFYWLPFLGWIFYFVLGFYCGHYYEGFILLLKKYQRFILVAPLLTSSLLLFLYHSDFLLIHSSKRIDILLHAPAMAFFIFLITHLLKKLPNIFVIISNYSFGIYLLHMFFISVVDVFYHSLHLNFGGFYIVILFLISTIASMASMYYINQWPIGKYLVGKLPMKYMSTTLNKQTTIYKKQSAHYD